MTSNQFYLFSFIIIILMSSNKNNSISNNNSTPVNNSTPNNSTPTNKNSKPTNNNSKPTNNNSTPINNNSKPNNDSSPPLNSIKNNTNSNKSNLSIESQKKLYNVENTSNKTKVNGNKVNKGNKVNGNKGNSVNSKKEALLYVIVSLSIILVIVILIFVYINFKYLKEYSKGRGDIVDKNSASPGSSGSDFNYHCESNKNIFGLEKTDCKARIIYSILDKTTGSENYITSKREGIEVEFKDKYNVKDSDTKQVYNEAYNNSPLSHGATPKNRSFLKTVNNPGKYIDIYIKGSLKSYDNITKEPVWKHDIKILKTSMVKKNIILVLVIASLLLTIILLIMKYQKI